MKRPIDLLEEQLDSTNYRQDLRCDVEGFLRQLLHHNHPDETADENEGQELEVE
jgi:hypothetical protein